MRYHSVLNNDLKNGKGLRVVLFVSGCEHKCNQCHNPETWSSDSGDPLTEEVLNKVFEAVDREEINGLTLTGGDPLYTGNLDDILDLVKEFRKRFGNSKDIWIYSGYTYEEIHKRTTIEKIAEMRKREEILSYCDVMVDGRFRIELADVNYEWAGSTNQKCIDLNATRRSGLVTYVQSEYTKARD